MKKTRILLIILGLFSMLIPLGITAQYILSVRNHGPVPSPFNTVTGFIPLIFGIGFIYMGFRLHNILSNTPKLPITVLRIWIVCSILMGIVSLILGHGINPIGLLVITAIYWYFSRALNKATEKIA